MQDSNEETQCAAGVGCCVTDSFNVCQSSLHRQSSCSVHCTAALPVLAGLADVEGISHTAPNARGSLCIWIKSTKMKVRPYFTLHSDPRALVLCDLILSTSANPPNTGRAAVQCTEQLLCLCWVDWQTLKESSHTAPTPADHCGEATSPD